tara:strand:+ start:438 stop:551 length:114 start_codon:yes stop_codon:yes gene_type:complete
VRILDGDDSVTRMELVKLEQNDVFGKLETINLTESPD